MVEGAKTQPQPAAARAVRRTVVVARVSGISLLVLGGISFLFAVTNPLSAGFLISAAVVVNGFIEWRAARRLEALDPRAPGWLALNQCMLGLEIAAYAAWQMLNLDPASVEALLKRPSIRPVLQLLDPAMLDLLYTSIPGAIRLLYSVAGVVAFFGCAGTALYILAGENQWPRCFRLHRRYRPASWRGRSISHMRIFHFTPLLPLVAMIAAGCSSIEYKVRESFGQQKRELLVDRVETAKDSQEEAKEQFVSALAQFKSLTGFQGGELERKYDQLQAEYDRCSERATDVSERIDAVDDVANALFREWEKELREYSSDALRRDSERKLDETKRSYVRLMEVMRNAESRMTPVLATLKDQVLYLKHNLNARAIASLGNVSAELQRDIDALVADMEKAIDDAARFIEQMRE